MKHILARFSSYFIHKYRVTILLIISILALGTYTYTTLLNREGFPPIDVPIVFIQTPYFVNDIDQVNSDVTEPIESILKDIPEIETTSSTTTANVSIVIAQLRQDSIADDEREKIANKMKQELTLPEGVSPQVQTVNAGSIDGENDMVFFITDGNDVLKLQNTASEIAQKVSELPEVGTATIVKSIETQTNPITGEDITLQTSFRKVGINESGSLQFHNAIAVGVKKKDTTISTLDLSDAVREKVSIVTEDEAYKNVHVYYGGDFAETLKEQISNLESNALSGLISVLIVLLLFLNFRSALSTSFFIPIVMAATFICLYLVGYSLNTIVLFSLILILGLFVDDAIVVVEAIDYQKKHGAKGIEAVQNAVATIGIADISGTVTTVLVFAPLLFITGILGEFIRLIPITVIIALILSVIVALSIIPFITSIFLLNSTIEKISSLRLFSIINYPFDMFSKFIALIGRIVAKIVELYLRSNILTLLVIAFSIVAIGYGANFAGKLDFSIFPQPKDTNEISMVINYPPASTIDEAQTYTENIETQLKVAQNYIESIYYFEGSNRSATAQINLTDLNSRSKSAQEIIQDLEAATKSIDTDNLDVTFDLISAGPPPSEYQFYAQIYDDDEETLQEAANEVTSFLNNKEISDSVYVTEVAPISFDTITRRDGSRYIEIKAKTSDPTNTNYVLTLEDQVTTFFTGEKLRSMGLAEDALTFDLGQESENLESFNSTIFALIAALVIMYILLVVQFDSFLLPLLILIAIPLSFPGLFPGLYLTNNALSFFVMLGITGLVGIVVNNSIMLIDYASQRKESGENAREAIAHATQVRFRPIITTSTTTIAGLIPLALTDPFWEPLSFSIIFGLISSSILVLLTLPAYYIVFEGIRTLRTSLWAKISH
ncbi:efflux RND transporter permease subunit [candidate division WWE3 bacterium]|uniref:Efflux RND transporter permease subunit n=1 Tax=candidate division WWE3 bacterium TaxID=2053526 RepID=A0A955LHH8_UNCKA|nr:efflux RND transporter permease subunit [candidate division WWE3 bacterium]